MKEEISKGYGLQETEICILLALKGVQELYGICFQGMEDITQEDIYRNVFQMLKKGILYKTENRLQIEETLDNWLDFIKNAEKFLVLADADELVPESYYYATADTVILLRPAGQQRSRLFMQKLTKAEMWEHIKNQGLEVKSHTNQHISPEGLLEKARECWYEDKEKLLQKQEIKQLLQEYDIDTKCKSRQLIRFSYGLDEYLMYSDEQEDKELTSWEGGEPL